MRHYDNFTPAGTIILLVVAAVTILLLPARPFYSCRHDHFAPDGRRDHFTPAATTILLLSPRWFYSSKRGTAGIVAAGGQKWPWGKSEVRQFFFIRQGSFYLRQGEIAEIRASFFIEQVGPEASF